MFFLGNGIIVVDEISGHGHMSVRDNSSRHLSTRQFDMWDKFRVRIEIGLDSRLGQVLDIHKGSIVVMVRVMASFALKSHIFK